MDKRGGRILIKGGRIVDPASGRDETADLLIDAGKIAGIAPAIPVGNGPCRVIDAAGKVVAPGLIDLHCHVREPGFEYKETIETAMAAATAGGFTTICCMPNTNPVNDNQSVTELVLERAEAAGRGRLLPIGAITKGLRGKALAEMGELVAAGCVAVSDDGRPVMDSGLMRQAMTYAKAFGIPVIDHCEDLNLTGEGVVFEGRVAADLGLPGIPAASETVMVARNIALAALTGGRVHLAHISTGGSVRLIREAKGRGLPVTAETCPHYFALTDEAVRGFNANAKMKPPLAPSEDQEAIRGGLADGTLDVIATDHAPHASEEKDQPLCHAPFGIVGLETALPLVLSLVESGLLTLSEAIAKMTVGPAEVLDRPVGRLAVGDPADITLIDPNARWTVQPTDFRSKGKNSPFIGWTMKGRATAVIVSGKVFENA